MSKPTVLTPIIDRNGVATSRHIGVASTSAPTVRAVAPVAPAALETRIERPVTEASDFAREVKSRYPGLVLHFNGSASSGYVTLENISVPKDMRGQGIATKVMKELVKEADANGWDMALTPSSDFGSSKARLVKFYSSFGFVPNSGRNKDYATRETMIRLADG